MKTVTMASPKQLTVERLSSICTVIDGKESASGETECFFGSVWTLFGYKFNTNDAGELVYSKDGVMIESPTAKEFIKGQSLGVLIYKPESNVFDLSCNDGFTGTIENWVEKVIAYHDMASISLATKINKSFFSKVGETNGTGVVVVIDDNIITITMPMTNISLFIELIGDEAIFTLSCNRGMVEKGNNYILLNHDGCEMYVNTRGEKVKTIGLSRYVDGKLRNRIKLSDKWTREDY
ncbi:MAG: hypothetical protein WAZ19_07475 [Anaerolineae bacterium]